MYYGYSIWLNQNNANIYITFVTVFDLNLIALRQYYFQTRKKLEIRKLAGQIKSAEKKINIVLQRNNNLHSLITSSNNIKDTINATMDTLYNRQIFIKKNNKLYCIYEKTYYISTKKDDINKVELIKQYNQYNQNIIYFIIEYSEKFTKTYHICDIDIHNLVKIL
jgi:hypothetical protein